MKIYNNIYDLNISIGGINIFEQQAVLFCGLDIYESIARPIPTCRMELYVPAFWLDEQVFRDGSPIEITIKSEEVSLDEKYLFRLFSIEELQLHQNMLHLVIQGAVDFYDGFGHPNEFNAYSTTSDIFKRISSEFNFKQCDNCIDNTNDQQLWIANNRSLYKFMGYLAQHGWKDSTSAMIWCIDRQKRLLYKNLTDLFKGKSPNLYYFYQSQKCNIEKKQFSYSTINTKITSGLNNIQNGGYGNTGDSFNLKDYGYKESKSNKANLSSETISVGRDVSNGLDQNWYGIDVGNTNEHYYDATNHNERSQSLFTVYNTLTIQYLQPYRLCQLVNLYHIDTPQKNEEAKLSALSGTCLITAIKTHITMTEMSGVVELAMQGLNIQNKTKGTY